MTNGKPLRGRQILCMIIDHYQINTHDKDYKNITDLSNGTLREDDVPGFITKWDDVLMRFGSLADRVCIFYNHGQCKQAVKDCPPCAQPYVQIILLTQRLQAL